MRRAGQRARLQNSRPAALTKRFSGMPCTRPELEERERLFLAPWAQFSADSRGRVHQEAPPEFRTQYQRDRDRVIHSRAFRRLEYKTQVFLNGTGDHLRTRLTHTMEVAAIGRNIARALRLNEDLTETIALAHDLGHPPFGHTGEAALNGLMRRSGGFEHNQQSLRVVELLEQKYPRFPGLNLSWEVREGLAKHGHQVEVPGRSRRITGRCPSLEAQVANLADEITYYSHDLDDGLTAQLLSEKQLDRDVEVWRVAASQVRRDYGVLPDESRRYYIIRCIIDDEVKDVVETSEKAIRRAKVSSADEVRRQRVSLIRYSPTRHRLNLQLRKYLYRNLYHNPEVRGPNHRAVRMLEELFRFFVDHPHHLDAKALKRPRGKSWPRTVCDHLAGMTDRYAILEYQRLFGWSV
jgi:dGTPase